MDPQQRILLEVAWEALEDAGLSRQKVAGSHTGVFIGMWTNEFEDRIYQTSTDIDLYITTGGGRYAASGRLSYIFDLQGPSLTLDTACSSSLVAVHLACQSIRAGEIGHGAGWGFKFNLRTTHQHRLFQIKDAFTGWPL